MAKISYAEAIQQQQDSLSETYVAENSEWVDTIYEIQEEDYVHGGTHGYDNVPHEQLANRTTFLKTTCETIEKIIADFQTQVANQDNENALNFANIKSVLNTLNTWLTNLQSQVDNSDTKFQNLIDGLKSDIAQLQSDLATHTHLYAGADTPGGDANTVKAVTDDITQLSLVGVDGNELKTNSAVTLQNNQISASKFIGDLEGIAKTARRLNDLVTISFYGDISGSYQFNGSTNISCKATLSEQKNVTAGTYGPAADKYLANNDNFIVPQLTVTKTGIISGIENKTYTLPSEVISGTTNATNSDSKMFLVGALQQGQKQYTYTNTNAYAINGLLYSQNYPVINTYSIQNLNNKTYEGYTLAEACSHGVDYNVQGTDKSKDLVTSNALYNHQHLYAGAHSYGGPSIESEITLNDTDKRYLTLNEGKNGKLEYNSQVSVEGNDLTAPVMHATEMMHIPGGRLWIDTSALAIDGSSFNTSTLAQIAQMQNTIDALTSSMITQRDIVLDFNVQAGQLLAYTKSGFVLADNSDEDKCNNVVIAISDWDPTTKTVTIANQYNYTLSDTSQNANDGYVGSNGNIVFSVPTASKKYIKKIGYVEGTQLIFQPASYAIYQK